MQQIIISVLIFILFAAIVIATFSLLNKFVFTKVSMNKWILLIATIILFTIQLIFRPTNMWINYGISALSIILFLWFLNIHQYGISKKEKEKKLVIRPKAKPNRVKNMNNNKNK